MKRLPLILLLLAGSVFGQTTKVRESTQTQGILLPANGGTGINNSTRTLTLSTNSGTILFPSAGTTQTFPTTTQTIAGLTEAQTETNKRITKRELDIPAPSAGISVNTDNYDLVHITNLATNITGFTMTGTPVAGDTLQIDITDNGTGRTLTWGGSFESSPGETLPSSTVGGQRLDAIFRWNQDTSKWRSIGSTDVSNAGASNVAYGPTWFGITNIAGSKNAVYNYLHLFDTDDDGVLGPGIGIQTPTVTGGTFLQATNGGNCVFGSRITNTGPTGSFLSFTNQGASTTLFAVDVSGTMTSGIVPFARITQTAANIVSLFSTCSGTQYLGADGACHTVAGGGTVTNTGGSLTSNAVVLGAGTNDTKVSTGIVTDGTAKLTLGVNTTTLGQLKLFGSTSGDATIQPPAVAGTATTVTLPNASSTLPIFGQQITFAGPTAARTYTLPDATTTVVDTAAAQTLTNKNIVPRTNSTTSATSWTPNFDLYDQEEQTALAGNITVNAPTFTGANDGKGKILRIKCGGTGVTFTSWNAAYVPMGVTLPLAIVASKTIYVGMFYNGNTSKWDVVAVSTEQ